MHQMNIVLTRSMYSCIFFIINARVENRSSLCFPFWCFLQTKRIKEMHWMIFFFILMCQYDRLYFASNIKHFISHINRCRNPESYILSCIVGNRRATGAHLIFEHKQANQTQWKWVNVGLLTLSHISFVNTHWFRIHAQTNHHLLQRATTTR